MHLNRYTTYAVTDYYKETGSCIVARSIAMLIVMYNVWFALSLN
jgi:hypothetical protein